jgi:methionyl-tRNA formyltransferase
MKMEKGLDMGAVYASRSTPVGEKNYTRLLAEIAEIGAELLTETLPLVESSEKGDSPPPAEQDENAACYAPMFSKADLQLFPDDFSAAEILRKIPAFADRPGAFLITERGRVKVYDAFVSDDGPGAKCFGALCKDARYIVFTRVMPEGKKQMSGEEYARGYLNLK